jgi:hypothetical protein
MVKLRFEISIPGASLKKQKIGAGAWLKELGDKLNDGGGGWKLRWFVGEVEEESKNGVGEVRRSNLQINK